MLAAAAEGDDLAADPEAEIDLIQVLVALRAWRRGDLSVRLPGAGGRGGEVASVFNELLEFEEQLARSRTMDAIGRFTGGVAHDFNNLLTVVLGNIDMLATRREDDARRARRIESVRQAAERGRCLTRQLLAFSRRQHLSPVTLDVNLFIRDCAPLVREAAGQAVMVEFSLAAEPLNVEVDPGQLEAALLNLAVNARDAMPGGGLLEIATRREPASSRLGLVVIEVRDSGIGMSAEIRDQAFEPFFTTKGVGGGSGLGLSQVYGFLRQSGGEVRLHSTPGEGAAFHLLLPASAGQAEAPRRGERSAGTAGGAEKILLVEDEPTVLALAQEVLSGFGYRVVTATCAAEALCVLRADRGVDLLFTDVVMPGGVNGLGLARAARALRPDLRVLLTSGFPGEICAVEGREFPLIDKPYEAARLASTVRALLDHPACLDSPRRWPPATPAA